MLDILYSKFWAATGGFRRCKPYLPLRAMISLQAPPTLELNQMMVYGGYGGWTWHRTNVEKNTNVGLEDGPKNQQRKVAMEEPRMIWVKNKTQGRMFDKHHKKGDPNTQRSTTPIQYCRIWNTNGDAWHPSQKKKVRRNNQNQNRSTKTSDWFSLLDAAVKTDANEGGEGQGVH